MTDGESVYSVQRIRKAMGNEPTRFVTAYVLSGMLAIMIPGFSHLVEMHKYHQSYYYAYAEQEDGEGGSGDVRDVNDCKWWQFNCESVWVNANGEYQQQNEEENGYYTNIPSWISGWGSNSGGGSRDGANAHSSGQLKFVYAWQMIMFVGLLAYGAMVLFKYRGSVAQTRVALQSLWMLIFFFGSFSFLSMWMLANGSIYTEGRALEAIGGFYHQFSVLMFRTDFWYCLWSIVYGIAVGFRYRKATQMEEGESTKDYFAYGENDTEKGVRSSGR